MKKNYFMLALASMMMAACANNDLVDEGVLKEEAPQAIEFETFANKTTRAEMNESSIKAVGFNVWGYKTANNTPFTVFNGVEVTWKEATNDVTAHWGYDDTQYWDETATYNFYAVAPYSDDLKESDGDTDYKYAIDETTGYITIQNAESKISTSSEDYVIDRAGNKNVAGSVKNTVEFDFNHIMAKLSFVLKKATDIDDNITVTKLTMSGWNGSAGTFTQSLNATPTDNSHAEWSYEDDDDVSGSFDVVASNLPIDATGVNVTNKYIVVPQTIEYTAPQPAVADDPSTDDDESADAVLESGLTFTISYIIGDVNTGEKFTEQVGVMTSNQVWGTDTHTTYTITVGPAAIEFSAKTVAGFQDKPGGSTTIQ